MIKKKTVIKYLKEVQKFCSSRDCEPKRCPLATDFCYPQNCILYGMQPNEWELPELENEDK